MFEIIIMLTSRTDYKCANPKRGEPYLYLLHVARDNLNLFFEKSCHYFGDNNRLGVALFTDTKVSKNIPKQFI